jgi:phospholipid transport system substrate-binding protein
MLKRFIFLIIIACCGLILPTLTNAGPAYDVINVLASKSTPILNSRDLSKTARAQQLQAIMQGLVDRDQMAVSMMGRYWRRADTSQKAELPILLEAYLLDVYVSRIDSVNGSLSFAIQGERTLGNRTLVDTEVVRPNAPNIQVAWQIEEFEGRSVITDIIIEGVSLVVSQRADFSSIIRQQGGLDGLITILRQKLQSK